MKATIVNGVALGAGYYQLLTEDGRSFWVEGGSIEPGSILTPCDPDWEDDGDTLRDHDDPNHPSVPHMMGNECLLVNRRSGGFDREDDEPTVWVTTVSMDRTICWRGAILAEDQEASVLAGLVLAECDEWPSDTEGLPRQPLALSWEPDADNAYSVYAHHGQLTVYIGHVCDDDHPLRSLIRDSELAPLVRECSRYITWYRGEPTTCASLISRAFEWADSDEPLAAAAAAKALEQALERFRYLDPNRDS